MTIFAIKKNILVRTYQILTHRTLLATQRCLLKSLVHFLSNFLITCDMKNGHVQLFFCHTTGTNNNDLSCKHDVQERIGFNARVGIGISFNSKSWLWWGRGSCNPASWRDFKFCCFKTWNWDPWTNFAYCGKLWPNIIVWSEIFHLFSKT